MAQEKALCPPEIEKKVVLLSSFTQGGWEEVPDPWYTGDFDLTYDLIHEGCIGVLHQIQAELAETSHRL